MYGSCVTRDGAAVLLVGPSGCGKSDLVLRLLAEGFELVADDQVNVCDGSASPPEPLAGLLEVRGIGIVRLPHHAPARVALVAELGEHGQRMPEPSLHAELGVPVVHIDASAASAPQRVALALDCVMGKVSQVAGFCAA